MGGLRLVARPALLLTGLVLAGLALRGLPGGVDQSLMHRLVIGHGLAGQAVFVLAGALVCAIGLPRQAVAFAGGYAFGAVWGVAIAMLAQLLGCIADFLWARLLARDWARRRAHGWMKRLDAFLTAHPFSTSLTLRLLPVGNNLALNLIAGVAGVAFFPFLAGTLIGYLPQTIVFVLLGGGVQVARGMQVTVAIALFAASLLLGIFLLRRYRALVPEPTSGG
jgi:uncharacterized membrane protein YdjX (TVP38/TMEM64 family)